MPPAMLISQLHQIGQMLNRWAAQLWAAAGGSVILFCLWVMALIDVSAQYGRQGRLVSWSLLMGLAVVLIHRLVKALSRPQPPQAVAVRVEQTFPQLDNHLINFLQFSAMPGNDPFKAAYVKMDVPHWRGLNFNEMKNRRRHRNASLIFAAAMVLLILPLPVIGRAWPVALWRIVNPFSNTPPVCLTHIVDVTPGDASVLQGTSAVVSCRIEGRRGHRVWLDIKPADAPEKTYDMGELKGRGTEGFSNTLFKVTSVVQYRFRAGDAFSPEWYTITPRPPLAFTAVAVAVKPPLYTGRPSTNYDGHSAAIDVPAGSAVSLNATFNAPVASLTLTGLGAPMPLADKGGATGWGGSVTVTNGAAFALTAIGKSGDKAEFALAFNLLPDRPPNIEIIKPKQSVSLSAGSAPSIDFAVSDDYGLSEVVVEKLTDPQDKNAPVEVLKTYKWVINATRTFTTLWKGEPRRPSEKGSLTLRITARDGTPGASHATQSASIVFTLDDMSQTAKKRSDLELKTLKDLNRIIDLQKDNIAKTRQYQGVATTPPDKWTDLGTQQKEIRSITKEILEKGGGRCLGNLVEAVRKLYAGEMVEAIPLLEGLAAVRDDATKGKQTARALELEEKILRQLTFAEVAVAKNKIEVRTAALMGILDGLITRENKIIKTTVTVMAQKAEPPQSLTTDQDTLGSDVVEFMNACKSESASTQGDDKDFSAFLLTVAAFCEEQKIRGDMLLAAEKLEKKAADAALPHEESAYKKLLDVKQKFDSMKTAADKEKNEQMIEALQNANKKLEKLKALEKKLIEAMDAVADAKNKNDKQTDKLEEDFEEIKKEMKDALLQVPKDLDIFADLNVGNDLVEDIFSTFEEVGLQAAGSEKAAGGPVKEMAVAKREYMLDGMEKVKGKLDEMESWLKKSPDGVKITTEAFDKEEMPNGVALTPLQTEMEDIIGDLLKENADKQDQDKDGAINSATPDMQVDGPITEGDVTCFAAHGRSGNETPDHKEQDGRSNVGRQGMADGETAAGSGTINKGDDNIEARRTKDPTQSGQVNVDGEDVKTKATGGGKLGTGKADEYGQGGGVDRMDSQEAGSMEAMSKLMAKQADATYAQASMKGMRSDSLKSAAHHMRQAADAIAKGNISQVAEMKRKAVADLKKAKTELAHDNAGTLDTQVQSSLLSDVVEAGPDEAPPKYRGLVSDYYKKLNESL